LGVFGEDDPLIPAHTVSALKAELGVHGEVVTLPHLGHDLWPDNPTAPQIQSGVLALRHIVRFLHTHLAERRP
jgi:pimeloyl-ACP methyl ester carboxylesterase